jgi:hypothetical protein
MLLSLLLWPFSNSRGLGIPTDGVRREANRAEPEMVLLVARSC